MHFAMKSEKNIEQYSRETTCGLISHTNLQKKNYNPLLFAIRNQNKTKMRAQIKIHALWAWKREWRLFFSAKFSRALSLTLRLFLPPLTCCVVALVFCCLFFSEVDGVWPYPVWNIKILYFQWNLYHLDYIFV